MKQHFVYNIPGYQDREAMKQEAWPVYRDTTKTVEVRAAALLRIAEAHYWRAIEELDARGRAYQKKVLGKRLPARGDLPFRIYVNHWLAANPHLVAPEIMTYLLEQEGCQPEENPYMPHGATGYYLEGTGRPARK
ncbi:MAG: hypothetical protein GX442_23640 [Candidatus Riflebacteria bacterium]|nr:hypothetical protein [Candidatus Riflebacteria bacterium]